ncbi:glutathione S-transferase kappa 1 [Massarina eburnea CBS 473.64]|uniref:Glutathione S-transferase kappa n=1 Tax=Massarina eburnea CBS 473.64 TaxID=1395130 RepID=A0A6A6S3I2_9PLEO|nr:glutathione S-transferase kappa 1 [Massarina eburnea CBS 473.64]
MSRKITAYIDCVSPYSYLSLVHLEKQRTTLEGHGVEIDIIPVFLGGINNGSGNKPPWTLPAKADYSPYDMKRSVHHHNVPSIQIPEFFPIVSLLPQRALAYIKAAYPTLYISAFLTICASMWQSGLDISKPVLLAQALGIVFAGEEEKVADVLEKAGNREWKEKLNANTKEALERGAFGCPWFWLRDCEGREEPFFGSDRFHFMWEFLGLPWKDVELLPAGVTVKAKI